MNQQTQDADDIELALLGTPREGFQEWVVSRYSAPLGRAHGDEHIERVREMLAEALGVLISVFFTTAYAVVLLFQASDRVFPGTIVPREHGLEFFLDVGYLFGSGIAFVMTSAAYVSGGHFNPAITACHVFFHGLPLRKAMRYIVAQTVGAFIAGLLIYHMGRQQFPAAFEGGLSKEALIQIFCAYPQETQGLGSLFFNGFLVDFLIGMITWAILDPTNLFASPVSAPITIGLVYATKIVVYGQVSLPTNLARDWGMRLAAGTFITPAAFAYRNRSWIGILFNVPATVLGAGFYAKVLKRRR